MSPNPEKNSAQQAAGANVTPAEQHQRVVHPELAVQLTRAAGRFARVAGRSAGRGYSVVAWRVLAELEQQGECRVSELAQSERVSQPSMTGILQRLENEGWVTRAQDPADGRATLASLTPAGAAALAKYRADAAARLAPHLAELSDFDRATLARAAELLQHLTGQISDPRA